MVRPENLIPGGSPVRTSPGIAPFRLAGVSDSGLRNCSINIIPFLSNEPVQKVRLFMHHDQIKKLNKP